MDYEYRKGIINTVKSGKRENKKILLQTCRFTDDSQRNDGKQMLKQIFMSTVFPNEFSCIPELLELSGVLQLVM